MAKILKKGIIYILTSEIGGVIYYGSTSQRPSQRLCEHKYQYNKFLKNNPTANLRSFEVLKYPDYKMIVLDSYENITKEDLEKNEGYYIANNECVNKNVAGATIGSSYARNYMKAYNAKKREEKLKLLKKIEL